MKGIFPYLLGILTMYLGVQVFFDPHVLMENYILVGIFYLIIGALMIAQEHYKN